MAGLYEQLMAGQQQQPFVSNQPYAASPGRTDYNTPLQPIDELQFRQWLSGNKVPFNPNSSGQDYDMRGFWQGLMQQNPRATSGTNPNDNQMHFSDYWKTPYHASFSNESQYANSSAPQWVNDRQLAAPSGRIVFDETQR